MELSPDLLKDFAKVTTDTAPPTDETTLYGTVTSMTNGIFVTFDGAEIQTPVSSAVSVNVGNRVMVLIQNHNAIITGNITTSGIDIIATINQMILERSMREHPVGSWYWSDDPTSPAVVFGFGVWTPMHDRVLVGAGGIFSLGQAQGQVSVSLTANEMPRHTHDWGNNWKIPYVQNLSFPYGAAELIAGNGTYAYFIGMRGTSTSPDIPASSGNGYAHDNMPPFYATYCWRRTR